MPFFTDDDEFTGPTLTEAMVVAAERSLGYRLPQHYIKLLFERNGGTPVRQCFPVREPTSWAKDHIQIDGLLGIGGEWGIDTDDGSAYMIEEWGYPRIGIVICVTPSAGHDTVMLDYRSCGRDGEPQVVHVGDADDDNRPVQILANSFESFINQLIDCSHFEIDE